MSRQQHSARKQPSRSEEREPEKPRWPDWSGQTAVIVATGPSLTEAQLDFLAWQTDVNVIAVNEAGLRRYYPLSYPGADILYAADRAWWQYYQPAFDRLRVSAESVPDVDTIPLKMLERGELMPREPGSVVSAGHSGFQALGLALTLGAARVVLLGYDCGGPARNCHAERPKQFLRSPPFDQWAQAYNRVPKEWPEVEIFNASEHTRITAFPIRRLEEVLT